MNGSLPFVGGRVADGGGLTNVTPSTDGVTVRLAVGVREVVGLGVAGHALLLGLTSAKPWNVLVGDGLTRGFNGIGGCAAGATLGRTVIVTTMLSDTCVPCARASAPDVSAAAAVATPLSNSVMIEA